MLSGIFSTSSGKSATENQIQIISNNLSNALTAGFKSMNAAFTSMNVQESTAPDQLAATYVGIPDCYIQFSDAPITATGNSLDLAIEGDGFFAVDAPQGTMYTRNGQFTLNKDKKLVNQNGYAVMSTGGGDITIDGKEITIARDGTVYADKIAVDKLKVVDFPNKQGLTNAGGSLFANTARGNAETPAVGYGVQQGSYEVSNVDIMKEMVQMITVMRAYESYTKLDQSASDMLGKLIDLGKF